MGIRIRTALFCPRGTSFPQLQGEKILTNFHPKCRNHHLKRAAELTEKVPPQHPKCPVPATEMGKKLPLVRQSDAGPEPALEICVIVVIVPNFCADSVAETRQNLSMPLHVIACHCDFWARFKWGSGSRRNFFVPAMHHFPNCRGEKPSQISTPDAAITT